MSTQTSTRTVTPAGKTIEQLRLERGWDVYEMARRAGVTPNTVLSVEKSNKCFLMTINGFRAAFGLPDNEQLLGGPSPKPIRVTGARRIQIRIRLRIPFTNFDFTDQLAAVINWLIKLIDPQGDVEVLAVAPGSVVITLEMDEPDTRKLVSAFGVGELAHAKYEITSIGIEEDGSFTEYTAPSIHRREVQRQRTPQQPAPQMPQKSLLDRFAAWLFGENAASAAPPPYKEEGASVFDRFKQKR